jgi:hypothetical protein
VPEQDGQTKTLFGSLMESIGSASSTNAVAHEEQEQVPQGDGIGCPLGQVAWSRLGGDFGRSAGG